MARRAVSNTGPLIHLSQTNRLEALRIVDALLIPSEVRVEFERGVSAEKLDELEIIETRQIKGDRADRAGALSRKYGLDLGEAEAIVLAKEEKITLIFTDDLDARKTALTRGLEPHGSVGILSRAYRDGIITEGEAVTAIRDLHSESSLYLTSDLVERAVDAVKRFSGSD